MAFKHTHLFLTLLVIASMFAMGLSNSDFEKSSKNWNFWFNYTNWPPRHPNPTPSSRKIIVGGSDNWRFGFNYTEWAMKSSPFFFNDTLGMYLYKVTRGGTVIQLYHSLNTVEHRPV
ncbi:hypothetical protein HanPI659440_Chr16g0636771 [Helianthus annuus]|nr:hypothetical protein HanPI659440_Chr16g0636771 [Helianthus annuus]